VIVLEDPFPFGDNHTNKENPIGIDSQSKTVFYSSTTIDPEN
jgi:hypothetical protein